MKTSGFAAILKSIKMRPFGSSGDDRRREDFERGRMVSGPYQQSSRLYSGGYGNQYGSYYRSGYDGDRFRRSQSGSSRFERDRYCPDEYARSHSLDNWNYNDPLYQYRSPSGGYRFENNVSPDRSSRNFRYPVGRHYDDRFESRYDDREFEDRQGRRLKFQNSQKGYGGAGNRYQHDQRYSRDGYTRYGIGKYDPSYYGRYGSGNGRYDQDNRKSYGYGRGSPRERWSSNTDKWTPGYDRSDRGFDRLGQEYDRVNQGNDRFVQRNNRVWQSPERFEQGYDRFNQGYDRFNQGYDRSGQGYDRFGLRSNNFRQISDTERFRFGRGRFGSDGDHFGFDTGKYGRPASADRDDRRYSPSRDRSELRDKNLDQTGRVRFESDTDDYRRSFNYDRYPREQRRASVSEPYFRRDYSRSEDRKHYDRKYGDEFAFSRDYRVESSSNMNKKFEPLTSERAPSRVCSYPSGLSVRNFEMQGGSEYQGGGLYGTQFGRDRMPPPIPPYTEPRSCYPTNKALTWYEGTNRFNRNYNTRCRELAVRASYDLMRRRYYENTGDQSQNPTWLQRGGFGNAYNPANVSPDVLRMDFVEFYPNENGKDNRTLDYELVRDPEQPNPVLRRGESFRMTMTFRDREFDADRDNIYLNFYFGPNPSVPKGTRVVLPVNISLGKEFERTPYQWDARIQSQDENKVNIEVFIPVTSQVGLWRCVIETSINEVRSSRLQYRCPEDIYILFNPFCRDDAVWMENDAQRFEYVMSDCGKVYTGGYRNVRGRPWVYGQFDDCVLPAACLLLEMSGLPHSERGNPVKVARALASMIKASKPDGRFGAFSDVSKYGLIETRYESDFRGGNTPHLWTGSVQIIEEFLQGGATPVKYAQCWVISALMTSLCRALGLPSRPVTAFVSALETQDSLTVDRYIDRFGDVIEQGPAQDQPDSVWSFHTWCDVWMNRPDQPQVYSGWQATDPCRSFRDFRDLFSGACGPCPVEALRRGDVGQRDDVDAFYSSLNAYVRYFYEDDESGWGYSPFRQFRYPMCRYVLTKAVGRYDDEGDNDCDDLTNIYRDNERSDSERFTIFNACRGYNKDMPSFEYQAASFNWGPFNPSDTDQSNFDVSFELDAPERVMIGQAVTIPVVISNNSSEPRNIHTNICTRSTFYTGACGAFLKRSNTRLTLSPNQQETVTLTLDPWDYMEKLVDMSFIKITMTSFVQETGQSFIDEFDFRFNKPKINIDVSELRVGTEGEATFSFVNPLDVPLTNCFLTMEVSGSVRPRTMQIDRDVGPHESFSFKQTFTPRIPGEHRLVASFVSRQLQDVVGQRPVVIREP